MASQRCNARELRLALGGDGCGSPPGLQAALFLRVVSCPCACWPVRHAFVPSTHSCAHPRPHQEQRRQQRLQRCSSARRHGALRCEAVALRCGAALPGVRRRGAVRCGAVRRGAARCGAVRRVRCDALRWCTALRRRGAMRRGAARRSARRCGGALCCHGGMRSDASLVD